MSEGIVSYAQNFEDVILWRVLAHVGAGNYVDVGAQSAFEDSVSRAFHEHGWKGVHVEPMPFYAEQLRNERPGDLIVQAMVGVEEGVGELFAMSGTGLSTSRGDLAEGYQRDGWAVSRQVVPVLTLDTVLDKVDGEIHWLKIDVEGAELQVLQGWHGSRRPWVLVVESNLPMSQEQNHETWDGLVVEKGYTFAYFDGLNRFYVSDAHPELAAAFGPGPNVFDRFMLSGTATSTFAAKLNQKLELAAQEKQRVVEEKQGVEAELAVSREERAHARERLAEAEKASLVQRLEAGEREIDLHMRISTTLSRVNELQDELTEERRRAMDAVAAAIADVAHERDEALARAAHLHRDLMVIHQSTSWVVTAPLRAIARGARWSLKAPVALLRWVKAKTMPKVRHVLYAVLRRAARQPLVKRLARRAFVAMPGLERRVRALHGAANGRPVPGEPQAVASGIASSDLVRLLAAPLPPDVSAQARQSLLRVRHAAMGAKS